MKPLRRSLALAIFILLVGPGLGCQHESAPAPDAVTPASYRVYFGTFTNNKSKGIYMSTMDARTGRLSEPQLVAETPSPSFLALNPNRHFIYACNEVNSIDGRKQGAVSAFSIDDATGKLSFLGRQPSAGVGPTHVWIDSTGKNVLVANYASGSVAVLPVRSDGALDPPSSVDQHWGKGVDQSRQGGPHAHSAYTDPSNLFVLSCDLGLDKVFVYRFDLAAHTITPNEPPFAGVEPGSGPRHLAFAPSGKFVYVLNEMACTVSVFSYDAQHGALSPVQTISTLPDDFKANRSTAEVFMHPSGKYLYSSNRGEANSITVFQVDLNSGKLTTVERVSTHGRTPRGFGIDPTGAWLIAGNQDTDNVALFRINQETGKLEFTGQSVSVPTPVCVTFIPR
jgi:6-phosphogluconolactonase